MTDPAFAKMLDEAYHYIRTNDVLLATREETWLDSKHHVANITKRVGDTLFQASGMSRTQGEAIVLAYIKWRNYWDGELSR